MFDQVLPSPFPGLLVQSPRGAAVGPEGQLFVSHNVLVERIRQDGDGDDQIDRIAGVFSTETRDLVRAGNGDLFTPLPLGSSDKILRIDPVTGSDSPVATGGLLVFPDGLVLEDGPDPLPDDDTNKRSLLVVDTNTSLTVTFTGNEATRFLYVTNNSAVTLNLGLFFNAVISFLVVAFAVFLLIHGLHKLQKPKAAPAATTKECPQAS